MPAIATVEDLVVKLPALSGEPAAVLGAALEAYSGAYATALARGVAETTAEEEAVNAALAHVESMRKPEDVTPDPETRPALKSASMSFALRSAASTRRAA